MIKKTVTVVIATGILPETIAWVNDLISIGC